jgi:hypothetical protein
VPRGRVTWFLLLLHYSTLPAGPPNGTAARLAPWVLSSVDAWQKSSLRTDDLTFLLRVSCSVLDTGHEFAWWWPVLFFLSLVGFYWKITVSFQFCWTCCNKYHTIIKHKQQGTLYADTLFIYLFIFSDIFQTIGHLQGYHYLFSVCVMILSVVLLNAVSEDGR